MSIRKMLPLMMVAVALLAASAAFAADAPAVPMSQEQFLSSLQAPAETNEIDVLHPVGSTPTPEMRHGSNCSYAFTCRNCPLGKEACDVYTCTYSGNTHKHWYCSGVCSNPCAI